MVIGGNHEGSQHGPLKLVHLLAGTYFNSGLQEVGDDNGRVIPTWNRRRTSPPHATNEKNREREGEDLRLHSPS